MSDQMMATPNSTAAFEGLGPGFNPDEAREPSGFALMPASRTKTVQDAGTKKDKTVYLDIFGYRIAKPLLTRDNNFGDPERVLELHALKPIPNTEPPQWSKLWYSIPTFFTDQQIREQTLARIEEERATAAENGHGFQEPTEEEIEARIRSRINGRQFATGTVLSLLAAVTPLTLADLESPEATGVIVGVGVGIRKFENRDGDTEKRNNIRKFFPPTQITDGSSVPMEER